MDTPGDVQMAIDAWLLQQHQYGKSPSVLRFYTWAPSAISLGYHQREYPQFWHDLRWQNRKLDVVRRPTGGRAVLHQGDLTYAVITSSATGTRLQMYSRICGFLIAGWRSLGVTLSYGKVGRDYIATPNCFATATSADLLLPDGVKLIGSAQLYRAGVVLQHGSMRLQTNKELFRQVFGTELPTTGELPHNLTIDNIINALISAAGDCFQMQVKVQPLSQGEWAEIMGNVGK